MRRAVATARLPLAIAICVALLASTGCYELVYERQDKNTVRRQFHLPRSACFMSFDSYPETPGWFGREGLQITATVGFPGDTFDEYVSGLDDPSVWRPTRYLSYSPSKASDYSDAALKWHDLPVPDPLRERFQLSTRLPEGLEVTNGRYYAYALVGVMGGPNEKTQGGYHWSYVGRTLSELTDEERPTVLALGVLDYDERLLHVRISFSG